MPRRRARGKKGRIYTAWCRGAGLFAGGMHSPRNFFESLRSCVAYLERCRADPGMSKGDAIDGIEERVSVMLAKALSAPTATSYCVFRLDDELAQAPAQ